MNDGETVESSYGLSLVEVKSFDEESRSIDAVVSTPEPDRDDQIVDTKAFDDQLDRFLRNPVLTAGHVYIGPAGEPTVIGHWENLKSFDGGLAGTAFFADTDLGLDYWKLYKGRHMRGFSVGYLEKSSRREKVGNKSVRRIVKAELLEIGTAAIPTNPSALARLKAMALATEIPGAGAKALSSAVETAVEAALQRHLSPDPGGMLHMLIADVADEMARRLRQGIHSSGDVPGTAGIKAVVEEGTKVRAADVDALNQCLSQAAADLRRALAGA